MSLQTDLDIALNVGETLGKLAVGILPFGGTAVTIVNSVETGIAAARKYGPAVIAAYNAIRELHRAQAPNVPFEEWLAQEALPVLTTSGEDVMQAAEKAVDEAAQ